MEDRSALLKVYNDRTTILNKGYFSSEVFDEYLHSKNINLSNKLLKVLTESCTVSYNIRPELLIESILQYLKGKRNFAKESDFLVGHFKYSETISWDFFRERFSNTFAQVYEINEIGRILQLVKRFGLEDNEVVAYEYLNQLVQTCHTSAFDMSRSIKRFSQVVQKVDLHMSWRALKKYKPAALRRPLEIISNNTVSILQDNTEKIKACEENKKSSNLRNKLFFQSFKNLVLIFEKKLKSECFEMVKDPYRFRNPYVHRSVFKMYLRVKNKVQRTLMNSLMRWSDVPSCYSEFMKSGIMPTVLTNENSVNFSRQMNFLNLSIGLKDKNVKTIALLLGKIFKSPVERILRTTFDVVIKKYSKAASTLAKYFLNYQNLRFSECIISLHVNSRVKKHVQAYAAKANYQSKRLKYSLPGKSRKLAARQISKILHMGYMRLNLSKFKKNSKKACKKLSQSCTRQYKPEPVPKPSTFSKSFALAPKELPQKLLTKFDDMKFSVKRIKYHHGLEKLWMFFRKSSSLKPSKKTPSKFLQIWKSQTFKGKKNLNLPTNRLGRSHNPNQFSFRDKY